MSEPASTAVGSTDWLCPLVRITGDVAHRLAASRKMPAKEPVFEITVEGNEVWMTYDSGMDYQIDGYTYETEWKLWPVESGHNDQAEPLPPDSERGRH